MKTILLFFVTFFFTHQELCAQTTETTTNCPCDYPSLIFKKDKLELSPDTKLLLAQAATKLKSRPNCSLIFIGYPNATKHDQALCQRRLDKIKIYFIEIQSISSDRITTNCEIRTGDNNTIDIKCDN